MQWGRKFLLGLVGCLMLLQMTLNEFSSYLFLRHNLSSPWNPLMVPLRLAFILTGLLVLLMYMVHLHLVRRAEGRHMSYEHYEELAVIALFMASLGLLYILDVIRVLWWTTLGVTAGNDIWPGGVLLELVHVMMFTIYLSIGIAAWMRFERERPRDVVPVGGPQFHRGRGG